MAKSWNLTKYARYVTGNSETSPGEWKLLEGGATDLVLTVSELNHLVIMHSDEVQESHALHGAHEWMKGIRKGDSMLFVYKINNESRRFRVKFADQGGKKGSEVCQECSENLGRHFFIKQVASTEDAGTGEDNQDSAMPSQQDNEVNLEGKVGLDKLAQAMLGELKVGLPLAYSTHELPTEHLHDFLRLCLSDSSFPAFVGQVEKALKKIAEEGA